MDPIASRKISKRLNELVATSSRTGVLGDSCVVLHLSNGQRYDVAIRKVRNGIIYGTLYLSEHGAGAYESCEIPISEVVFFSKPPKRI